MRQIHFVLLCLILLAPTAWAGQGKVLKVLPEFSDLKGRTSLAPSLYDRDAYQAILRKNPKDRSGLVFFVNWKVRNADPARLKLRVELRGVLNNVVTHQTWEQPVKKQGWFSQWTDLRLKGEDYQQFGNLIAWRVSLWEGDQMLSDQKSFLW